MSITLRPLNLPEDYAALAELLNTHWSEPTTAARLEEEDGKLYEQGHTYLNADGLLEGYDRTRQAAVSDEGEIVGYVWCWRAPWTEPGYLNCTIVTAEAFRRQGAGDLLLRHAVEWGAGLGATAIYTDVWDDSADSLRFAEKRGFSTDRHAFQSVLELQHADWNSIDDGSITTRLEAEGIRFTTLADVPLEQGEQKLYELYQETLVDIPGFTGDIPHIDEWRKWYLKPEGYAPEQVIIATDGDIYVGVSNVLRNHTTNGMYHEYTGVRKEYRGRKIALALKIKALLLAKERHTPYMRTDNDSLNHAMLGINRRLGYQPLRGSYRLRADVAAVEASLKR